MSNHTDSPSVTPQYANVFSVLRLIVRVPDINMNPEYSDLLFLLLGGDPGQVEFTNSLGETYILTQTENNVTLSLPENDNTGDPATVEAFNSFLYT